jgi:hypothetical protein
MSLYHMAGLCAECGEEREEMALRFAHQTVEREDN